MLKSQVKKLDVSKVLEMIYYDQILESSLNDLPKDKLIDFILEIFNKGILRNYLKLG